jgi:hypothetical protein
MASDEEMWKHSDPPPSKSLPVNIVDHCSHFFRKAKQLHIA